MTTWSLADLGVDAGRVGLAASATRVVGTEPPRPAGRHRASPTTATGAAQLADFLAARGLL